MRLNKKIVIPVLAVIAIIVVAVSVVGYFHKSHYVPVSFVLTRRRGK